MPPFYRFAQNSLIQGAVAGPADLIEPGPFVVLHRRSRFLRTSALAGALLSVMPAAGLMLSGPDHVGLRGGAGRWWPGQWRSVPREPAGGGGQGSGGLMAGGGSSPTGAGGAGDDACPAFRGIRWRRRWRTVQRSAPAALAPTSAGGSAARADGAT